VSIVSGTGAALCGVGLMAASAWLISRAAQHPPILYLTVAIVAVRAFGIGRAVLRYGERLASHDAAFRALGRIRVRAYERLEASGTGGLRSGDLVSRFVDDMDAAMDVLTRVVAPYAVAAVAGAMTVAFVVAVLPAAGVVLLVGLLVVGAAVPFVHSRLSRRADAANAPLRGELTAQVVELLHGAPELAMAGATQRRLAAIDETDRRLRAAAARTAGTLGVGGALAALAGGACVWLALWLGAGAVRAGTLDGVLLAVVVLTPLAAFELVAPIPAAAAAAGRARTALGRVFAILDRPAAAPARAGDQPVRARTGDQPVRARTGDQPLPAPPYHLRWENVQARWTPDGPDVFTGFSLDLPAGARVALVGPSGCGKSTVAALAARLLDPVRGAVTLNGVDLRDLDPEQVRRVVGLVAEDAHVFDTTIGENLRLGRLDATEQQLRDALARVNLLDWVDRLPAGLSTVVGEGGCRLSGGQRRRLVLARALLADSPILILDEPTEHLDESLAQQIVADLLDNLGDRSLLLITHREHGLAGMDAVVPWEPPHVTRSRGDGPS